MINIPIIINDTKVFALVDTGAAISVVTPQWVKEHNIPVTSINENVTLAGDHTHNVECMTQPIGVRTDTHYIKAAFRVMPLSGSQHVLLGQDILPLLGISVSGLPTDFYTKSSVPTPRDYEEFGMEYTYVAQGDKLSLGDVEIQEYVLAKIKPHLDRNTSIPKSKYCNVPESIVRIDTGNATPRYVAQYRIAFVHMTHVDNQILTWDEDKVILPAPAGCRWNSPLLCVPKKDSDGLLKLIRVCIDPRAINAVTVDDKFPLPTIRHILDSLGGMNYFTTIDLASGYNQFLIHPDDRVKTAFTHRGEVWMFARAPFGLKNLPSIFQRVMQRLLGDMPNVYVYIDDIIISSKDIEEHIESVIEVLNRLTSANLRIKLEKCVFAVPSLAILGHIVSRSGVRPDPIKIKKVLDWPRPTNKKVLESFLGLVNYFNAYIPFYSMLTQPLNQLKTIKGFNWAAPWDGKLLEAFTKVKEVLSMHLPLAFPDFDKPFYLATDASTVGIGGVLFQYKGNAGQVDETSKLPVLTPHNVNYINFMSRSLKDAERSYSATKLELTAIIYCFRRCKYYLQGRHFYLITDHKALTYILTQKLLNPMLIRWFEEIIEFNFTVSHCPGSRNVLPDILSRLYPTYASKPDTDEIVQLFNISSQSLINSDWMLNPREFRRIDNAWGPHTIDLCATLTNRQIDRFCTVHPVDSSGKSSVLDFRRHITKVGAFKIPLQNENAYANPPFTLIEPLVKKVIKDKATMTIVAPVWPKEPWFNLLTELCVDVPMRLEHTNDLFLPATTDSKVGVGSPKWGATCAWRISAKAHIKLSDSLVAKIRSTVKKAVNDANKYNPYSKEDIDNILTKYHLMGHFGIRSIIPRLKENGIHWPNMWNDVSKFLSKCTVCNQFNDAPRRFTPYRPVSAALPMDHIQMDLHEFSVASNEYVFLMVLIDVCSKFCWLRALKDKRPHTVADKLWKIFTDFGFPKIIQSDNGSEFANSVITELVNLCCIDHRLITSYNPRADGGIERTIKDVSTSILKHINGARADWSYMVGQVQLWTNLRTSSVHGSTPFTVMFSRNFNGFEDTKNLSLRAMTPSEIEKRYQHARKVLFPDVVSKTADINTRRRIDHDSHFKTLSNPFPDGAIVMLKQNTRKSKMEPKYIGPFKILRLTQGNTYVLQDLMGDVYPKNVPAWRLKMVSNDENDEFLDNDEYEIEAIINHKGTPGNYTYKVKWKGYPESDNSWINASDINAPRLVHDYWARVGKAIPWRVPKKKP